MPQYILDMMPALVSPKGNVIQTPIMPQLSTKPQKYPIGKDIKKYAMNAIIIMAGKERFFGNLSK